MSEEDGRLPVGTGGGCAGERRSNRCAGHGSATDALAVLTVAAVAHLSFYLTTPPIHWLDSARYVAHSVDLPHRLATGAWDLWTSPAYPFLVWLVRAWTESAEVLVLVQQCLAVATCLLVWLATRKILGARAALIGALVVALSPDRHYYAQTILSEPLAELFLVAGFTILILAIDAPLGLYLFGRALAGLVLGVAALTRPNLAPAAVIATLTPIVPDRARHRPRSVVLGMLLTAVTAMGTVTPWLVFNAQRGVAGFTGSVGYTMIEYANSLGVGTPLDLRAEFPLRTYTAANDRELVRLALLRFLSEPIAYLDAVGWTAVRLFVPLHALDRLYPGHDVSPFIGLCKTPPHIARILASDWPTFAGFDPGEKPPSAQWRCHLHRVLIPLFAILITIGWVGLTTWIIACLWEARFDLALLASAPLACMLALLPMIQANTRYAFPGEAIALGFGLPAGIFLVAPRMLLPKRMRKDESPPPGES